jgi:cell division protein FtsB
MQRRSRIIIGASLTALIIVGATSAGIDVHTSRAMVQLNETSNDQNVELIRLSKQVAKLEKQLADAKEVSAAFVAYMTGELKAVQQRIEELNGNK